VGDFNRNYSYREEGASMSEYKEHGFRGHKRKEVYQSLYEKQGGRCAICEKGIGELSLGDHGRAIDKLFIEHCHKTGKIRGLVCTGCNNQLAFTEHERIRMRPEYRAYLESRANVGWSDEQ